MSTAVTIKSLENDPTLTSIRSQSDDTELEAENLVEVSGLNVSFNVGKEPKHVVRDVAFSLKKGKCLAIVGESGSGKSVTARTLIGLTGEGAEVSGKVRVSGHDVLNLTSRQWRDIRGRNVGFVSQDALVSLNQFRTIADEVGEALRLHTTLSRRERQALVIETLKSVGIPDAESRLSQRAFQLSGGLRQRALIASALVARPSLLIADEPTTALDVTIQAQILDLLKEIKNQNTGLLLISHDLAVVNHIADEVIVMKDGLIVEAGPTDEILNNPQHPYTNKLRDSVPSAHTKGRPLTQFGASLPATSTKKGTPRENKPVLQARGLDKSYKVGQTRRRVVKDISFEVFAGETLGIVGESGSGKTTTARLILALIEADRGEVLLKGAPWTAASKRQRRKRHKEIGVVFQDPLSSFDPRWTVAQILRDVLRNSGLCQRGQTARSIELLELVGLSSDHLHRRPLRMSGGQRQRIAIARALALDPDIIICDEPVSALDVSVQGQVLDLLVYLQRKLAVAYVFISHDLGVVNHISDRVIVMKDGEIIEQGASDDVFDNPQHPYTKKLVTAVPALEHKNSEKKGTGTLSWAISQ